MVGIRSRVGNTFWHVVWVNDRLRVSIRFGSLVRVEDRLRLRFRLRFRF